MLDYQLARSLSETPLRLSRLTYSTPIFCEFSVRKQILGLQEFANWGAERSLIKRSANLEFVLLLQLAASIPRTKNGSWLQMKLAYNNLTPIFLFFIQWMNCSCAPRKATKDLIIWKESNIKGILWFVNYLFTYTIGFQKDGLVILNLLFEKGRSKIAAVILPSLQHLHSYSSELDYAQEDKRLQPVVRKRPEERKKLLMLIWRERMNVGSA
ncbi:hypothetical protein CK203_105509 [Vitis vinifera]|uniref:Uncharacterized protein n=1 Tax=Vitis vinifera TaxID=29760 RepID=A0A438FGR2_VITVI|nr:hypothetical protein CK203_105509 [Vitis vinifera]